MSKVFLDTNIFIYALDKRDAKKQLRSRELLGEIIDSQNGCVSTQVIQEFYVSATKKLGVKPSKAMKLLDGFDNFEVIQISVNLIMDAARFSSSNKISFWDALIIAAAKCSSCSVVMSEDLNSGQRIGGVRIENPF